MKPKDVDYHHLTECVGAQVKVKIPLLLVLWIAKKNLVKSEYGSGTTNLRCYVRKFQTQLFRVYKNPPNLKKNDPSQIPSAYEEYSELISREKLVLWNEPCEKQSGSGAGRRQAAKLYIPSTIKSILMLWHTKWALCALAYFDAKKYTLKQKFTIFSLLF